MQEVYSFPCSQNNLCLYFLRISIEVTPEQHQRLKVCATLAGKSIKDYVLERVLVPVAETEALEKLESFLKPRLESTNSVNKSVSTIFSEGQAEGEL